MSDPIGTGAAESRAAARGAARAPRGTACAPSPRPARLVGLAFLPLPSPPLPGPLGAAGVPARRFVVRSRRRAHD